MLSSPRIIGAFMKFMLNKNPKWVAEVMPQSPQDVRLFITKKCAAISEGGEGKKVLLALLQC